MRRIVIPFTPSDAAAAVVCARSAREAGAESVVALATAHDAGGATFARGVDVVDVVDLGIDLGSLGVSIGAYGVLRSGRAVLADALRALDSGDDRFVVLAPHMRVLGPLDPIWTALESSSAAVLPTLLSPSLERVPERRIGIEKHVPSPPAAVADPEVVGAVNRGVIGFRPAWSGGLLDRWPARAGLVGHHDAVEEQVHQRWLDAAALAEDVAVVRDPGSGIGWFNVRERSIERVGVRLVADGSPISLMDLREFDPRRWRVLAPAQQIGFASESPALVPVLEEHGAELLAAGWVPRVTGPFPLRSLLQTEGAWARTPDGEIWAYPMRRLFRILAADGILDRSPFTDRGNLAAREAFRSPAPRGTGAGLNRLLWNHWLERHDIRRAYPFLDGADGPGFIGWAWAFGRDQDLLPEDLLPEAAERYASGDVASFDAADAPASSRLSTAVPDAPVGLNVAGYFSTTLGLGESARQLVRALQSSGVDAQAVQGRLIPAGRGTAAFDFETPDRARHPVSLAIINGDSMGEFARDVGEDFFRDRYTIGYWWWEVDPYPAEAWSGALRWLDEIWVGTDFVHDLIAPHVNVPVTTVRVPVAEPPAPQVDRARFGLSEEDTVFLYIWDYESSGQRKNPLGLVKAYLDAFDPDDGAHLVLKCIGKIHRVEEHEEILVAIGDRTDITVIDDYLPAEEKDSLIGLSDCYVSPHRSEGFGYTPAEAMAYGKPVICTAFGGVTDFADASTALLVDWEPAVTGPFAVPYPIDGRWADPDLAQVSSHMRWVHESPQEARELGARAARRIRDTHSYAAAGAVMRTRLDEIYARARPAAITPPAGTGSVDGASPALPRRVARAVSGRAHARFDQAVGRRTSWLSDIDTGLREAILRLEAQTAELQHQVRDLQIADRERGRSIARERQLIGHDLEMVAGRSTSLEAAVRGVEAAARRLEDDQHRHRDLHQAIPFTDFRPPARVEPGDYGEALHVRFSGSSEHDYGGFLERFRGPWARVRELAEPYAAVLEGRGPVLDVGCGRGELLDVLREAGIDARGVDTAPELVAEARTRDLDVLEADGVAHLREQADGSLGAVVALHVVEHLRHDELVSFFVETGRVLRQDGLLLVETVNPSEVSAQQAFWLDPTHQHPLFPEVLMALGGDAGFADAWAFAPGASGDWRVDRANSPRYAVVLKR